MTCFVAVFSSYCCCHVLTHWKLLRFSNIFLENSTFCFLSVRLLKMLRAAFASCFSSWSPFNSPLDSLFKWVPASFMTRLSAGAFFPASCSFMLAGGAAADLEAAATWVHQCDTLGTRTVLTGLQLHSSDMSQQHLLGTLVKTWTERGTMEHTSGGMSIHYVVIFFIFFQFFSFFLALLASHRILKK